MGDKNDNGSIEGFGISFGKREVAGTHPRPTVEEPEVDERAPFRIVAFCELAARDDFAAGSRPRPDPVRIDATTFDLVMVTLGPALVVEVSDPFVPSAPPLAIELRWDDRKALRPEVLLERNPVLAALVEARRTVQDVHAGKLGVAEGRGELTRLLPRSAWASGLVGEIHAPAPLKASPPATGLDALFDMVDLTADLAETPAPARRASPLLAAVLGQEKQPPVVGTSPQRLDAALARIVSEVYAHPEVRRLERAWRGLRLLVEHCDTKAGVEVDVVAVGPDGVADALKRLLEEPSGRSPIDLIVVDMEVEPTAVDLGRLEMWGGLAEGLWAPVLVSGSPRLCGAASLSELGRSSRAWSTSREPEVIAVRSLASREASRWVGVVLNSALVRAAYTPETSRLRGLGFTEASGVKVGAAWVVAALAARSFARSGWPTSLVGAQHGVLGGLAVEERSLAGQTVALALEATANDDAVREVARAGFMMLTCAPNRDEAVLLRAPVLFRGASLASGADTGASSTLADQLFVGRLARAILQVAGAIPAGTAPEAAAEVAHITLAALFPKATGPELRVQVVRDALQVVVRPRRFGGVSLDEVTLVAPLG
jgi:predicted component of type VI protein secretion system